MIYIAENAASAVRREPPFPHRRSRIKESGKGASACLLTALLSLMINTEVRADATAQVRQAVEQHLRLALEQHAKHHDWQGMQLRYDINLPASSANLAKCSSTLRILATGDAPSFMDRQQLRVECPDGWHLNATGQTHVFLPVAHAEGIIDRGQTLTLGDLKLQRINIAKARRGYYNRLDEVVGLAAKRRIRAGQTITPALIEQAMAVRRGQPVRIVASNDGIEASTSGEALGDGQPGDVIRVRNTRSGKVIDAKVMEQGVVTSTF